MKITSYYPMYSTRDLKKATEAIMMNREGGLNVLLFRHIRQG